MARKGIKVETQRGRESDRIIFIVPHAISGSTDGLRQFMHAVIRVMAKEFNFCCPAERKD